MKTKAIIIGGSGRVGQALARELATMYETVILITRTQPKVMSENMHVYHVPDFQSLTTTVESISIGDDTDAFSCLGVSKEQTASRDEFYQVNVLYNMEFARVCQSKGVGRFFFVSMTGAENPQHNDELMAKADVEYYLKTLNFQELLIFRLSKLTPINPTLSVTGVRQLLNRTKDTLVSAIGFNKAEPLSPSRAAASIAIVAFRLHARASQKSSKQVQIISHEQMCQLTEPKKSKRKFAVVNA